MQGKSLYSEALGKKLRLKVTAGALRTIDKVGGLDAYLFRMKPDRLGEKGIALRKLVSLVFLELSKSSLATWGFRVSLAYWVFTSHRFKKHIFKRGLMLEEQRW